MRRMNLKKTGEKERKKKDDPLYRERERKRRNRVLLHTIIDLPILRPDVSEKISFL